MNKLDIEAAQSEIFDSNGAFFAFGNEQFEEKCKKGIKYTQLRSVLLTCVRV